MRLTRQLEVSDASHVGEARRVVGEVAAELGFDAEGQGRVALVVTEVAKNLLKHARSGQLLVNETREHGRERLQVLAADSGPGLADAGSAMRDGYSTVGTPGTGLGAMRRMSDRFDLYSSAQGTVVLCEFASPAAGRAALPADVAAIAVPKRGETLSGDGWTLCDADGERLLMVVDGLGHGLQAADAATAALAVMQRRYPSLEAMMQDVHAALRPTRGAAVGIARVTRDTLEYLGVGNVVCRVAAPAGGGRTALDKQLVSHNGTVGHSIRRTDAYRVPLPSGGVVLMHTDGVSSRFALADHPGLFDKPAALIAGVLFQSHARPADDATIVALRTGHAEDTARA